MEDKAPMTRNRTFSLALSNFIKKARPNKAKVPITVTKAKIGPIFSFSQPFILYYL